MKIEVKDLKVGDEIIISNFSELRYLKVLKTPELSGTLKYYNKVPLYKAVKCSVHSEDVANYAGRQVRVKKLSDTDLNTIIYKDLEGRDVWLVKRDYNTNN